MIDVHSWPTPNGHKVHIMLEECGLRLGRDWQVHAVNIGTGRAAQIGRPVAGKTGTAQNGDGEPYTLWFTGFAPADNPQVAVAVVVANGGGIGQAGRGNSLAAPIAKKVMEAVLRK